MEYHTFEPTADLQTFIKCYWTLDAPLEMADQKQTIVPDGCMEMIFHYGDLYQQYLPDGESIVQPRCFVIGQLTRPLEIAPTGRTGIFSVRFQPNGFLPFANLPIREMENTAVALERSLGETGPALSQNILAATDTLEKIRLVEIFLSERLLSHEVVDRTIGTVVETILSADGRLSITTLIEKHGIDRRQLERKFSTSVGLSPKQLSKIVRLQGALKNLIRGESSSFTTLAYENDYYDQAHFIKDFKDLTGFTPKEFYRDELKMSNLFNF